MHLTSAAEAMVRELRDLANWEHELTGDLNRTRSRLGELTQSLDALARLLPLSDRVTLRLEVAKVQMPLVRARRQASVMTDKVAAVHEMLAAAEDSVHAADVQRELVRRKLTADPGAAHSILSRKIKQGMVERLSRGLYRVNPHHPEIIRRRFRAELAAEAARS